MKYVVLVFWLSVMVVLMSGCSTASLKDANKICASGNISAYNERDADRELTFVCQSRGVQ